METLSFLVSHLDYGARLRPDRALVLRGGVRGYTGQRQCGEIGYW